LPWTRARASHHRVLAWKSRQHCEDGRGLHHSGNIEKDLCVVLDIEQIAYEVTTFLDAASSMINRLGDT
jgi:hypothetical protein